LNIAEYIDHTLLKADATGTMVKKICQEAVQYGFASVCVNSGFAELVSGQLSGSKVRTCVVSGFPLGASQTLVKAFETREAIKRGAQEIDMVLNIGALKEGLYGMVEDDIKAVVQAAGKKAVVKVILECCLLENAEKEKACELAVIAGAAFVKTSTGFASGGATIEDVRLLKNIVGTRAKVKASGGIRTATEALAMIEAGADRLGTSSGIKIAGEFEK
jgi:deoxyribose-phosphate aldolase